MPNDKSEYISLIQEIIAKQAVILGPEIAILKAKNVKTLVFTKENTISDIIDDPNQALQNLINEYVSLSGEIVKNALGSVFAKYPSIKTIG